ncbi:MAG TPA: hypothetical protein VFF81_10470 [Noviherbaspirillum sp.]|nr:hypothetical protein [Noviherbaspirillum sp.]
MHSTSATAQQTPPEVASKVASTAIVERYPAGSIKTVETADAALADVGRERAAIEARFSAEEQACHPKFFTTSCVEKAKERRRQALARLRKVELEANAFKRQDRAQERDKAVAERQARAEADRLERERALQEKPSGPTDAPQPEKRNIERSAPAVFPDRVAEHEGKMKRLQQEEQAGEKRRAEKVADYEKKVKAAQERQRKIAERKAKKEAKQRAKQASQQAIEPTGQ